MKLELKSKYINVALNVLLMFAIIILCPILTSAEDGYTEIYFDKQARVPYYDGQFYDGMKFVIVDNNDRTNKSGSFNHKSDSRMYYTVISAANRQLCLDKTSGCTYAEDGYYHSTFDISRVIYISGPFVTGNYTIEKIEKIDCRNVYRVCLDGFDGHEFCSNMFLSTSKYPQDIRFGDYFFDLHLKDYAGSRLNGNAFDGEELLLDLQYFTPGVLNGVNPKFITINYGGKQIPSNLLKNCKKLKSLYLYAWNLKSIPNGFFKSCTNLENIYLDAENVKKLNGHFANNKKLKTLEIGIQQIDKNTFKGQKRIVRFFLYIKAIREIKKDAFAHLKDVSICITGDGEDDNSRKLKLKRVEKGAFNGVELIGLQGLNSADERKVKKLIKNKGCKKIID